VFLSHSRRPGRRDKPPVEDRMFKWFALSLLVVAGCGPRTEVAIDKVRGTIDALLGETDVKRKEIARSLTALDEAIVSLQKARIKATLSEERLGEQLKPLEERRAAIDVTLGMLRERLAAGEGADLGGKTYPAEEVRGLADRVIAARRDLEAEVARLAKSRASLNQVIASLDRQRTDYESRLTRLRSQVAEIDAKAVALKTMRQAASSMGRADGKLAGGVADLEDQVASLFSDIEAELVAEDMKWNEQQSEAEIDAVIATGSRAADTLTEIDRILGGR